MSPIGRGLVGARAHLLINIVGEDVRLCNCPFNYSDRCFHYQRFFLPLQHSLKILVSAARKCTTQADSGSRPLEKRAVDAALPHKKSPAPSYRHRGQKDTMHRLRMLLTTRVSTAGPTAVFMIGNLCTLQET